MKKLLLVLLLCLLATPAAATVNETVARNDYTGNGTTTAFPYTFRIIVKEALQVYLDTTLQVLDVAYNVTGVGNSAGTVVFLTPPPTNSHITILRKQAKQQTSVYQPNEAFPAKRIETDYDKNMMADQQQEEEIGRALKFYPYSLNKDVWVEDPINGKCLQWSTAAGNFIVTSGNCAGGGGGGGGGGNVSGSGIKGQNAFWLTTSDLGSTNRDTYVGAFGTTRAAIQDAIDSTGEGGIVHFECLAYTLDSAPLLVTKNLTIVGCSAALGVNGDLIGPGTSSGTVLSGAASTDVFQVQVDTTTSSVNTGVFFRDLNIIAGASGRGIVSSGTPQSGAVYLQNVAIRGGAKGYVASNAITAYLDNVTFTKQTVRGVEITGWNCDQGNVIIKNSGFSSDTAVATDAVYLEHIAAISVTNTYAFHAVNGLHIAAGTCAPGTAPTQIIITGNQLSGFAGGHALWLDATVSPMGNVTITGNYFDGPDAASLDTVLLDAGSGTNFLGAMTVTGNIARAAGGAAVGCYKFRNLLAATVTGNTCDLALSAGYAVDSTTAHYSVVMSNFTIANPNFGTDVLFVGSGYTLTFSDVSVPTVLANLPSVLDGSQVWCTDCALGTNPCAGSGGGALAQRFTGQWYCGSGLAMSGAPDQIAVFAASAFLQGYADFTWSDTFKNLVADDGTTAVTPSVTGLVSIGNQGMTYTGVTQPITHSGAIASHNGSILGAGGSLSAFTLLLADDSSTLTGPTLYVASIASNGGSITNSTYSAKIGAESASITDATNAVAIGGTNGSIASALNAVSINSGVVATNNTTAVGGTRFDVTYLGGAGVQCLQADNNGTIQASGAACGGGGLAIPATQIVVGTGPSVASFADFTWNETDQTLNAGANTIGAGTINSSVIGAFNTTQAASNQNFIFGRFNGGSVGGQDIIVGQFNDASTNPGGFGGLFGDSNTATVLATGTCYSWGSTNVCDAPTASNFGHGNTASGLGGAENHGQNNNTSGADAYSFGFTITNSGDNCVVLGQVIGCTHAGATVIGQGTNSVANNSISLGVLPTPEITITAGITSVANTDNGASANIKVLTEELTILAAANTDTAFQFPAGSTSLGCTVRVTTVIPTATTFDTGVAGATTRYTTGTSTVANTTGGSAVFAAYPTATSVRITPNLTPGAATGTVRVTCPYIDVTPATS